jgi:DNA-binding transcriptional MocR family regulator
LDRNGALLDDRDARGEPRLRAALATWLARSRGLAADPAAVHTGRGAQNGLYLAGPHPVVLGVTDDDFVLYGSASTARV